MIKLAWGGLGRRLRDGLASLKLRLTLGSIAALTLGISVITVLLVQRAEHDMLAGQHERELAETVRTASVLSARVVALQNALRVTSEQLDERRLHDPAALERFFNDRAVLRNMFRNMLAATPDGHVRIYADRDGMLPATFHLSDRDYFRQTLAEDRPIVSEARLTLAQHEPVIVLTHPLRGPQGLYGVIAGSLRLRSGDLMSKVLQQQDVDNDHGTLVVVTDTEGRILGHPDGSRILQPLSGEPRLAGAWADWQRLRNPLEPAGVMVQQPGELVSVAAVSGPEWLVWRTLPESRVLEPLHDARRYALKWATAMVLLTSLGLLLLLAWQLRPLRALERRAQYLFDAGHDPHAGWPEVGGEIGRLTRVLRHVGAERAQMEAVNGELLDQLKSVMAAAPVGIAFTRDKHFQLVNAEFCRLFGHSDEQGLAGRPVADIGLDDEMQNRLLRHVYRALAAGHVYSGEWQFRRRDGSSFWAALGARPTHAAQPAQGIIWTVSDVSAHVAARSQLEWSAYHDPLTGLANRAAFDKRLASLFATRPQSLPAALVAIDLDHFKPINDTAGHAAGDAMLKAVADAIRSCVRAGDLVVRIGGDEFALLLEHCPEERALRVADQVCQAIAGIELRRGGACCVSAPRPA